MSKRTHKIDTRADDTSAPAFVAPVRGLFEILSGESFILKGSELLAQSFELSRLSDSREQLLTNRSDEPRQTILNEFVQ